ncbi:hypothetical protein LJC38_01365 [Parabacteroides sp. OttesenSCG-928-K15]|nr:hypothetical protein [Parabacteroides sp. OttesenSCG-928-K15]
MKKTIMNKIWIAVCLTLLSFSLAAQQHTNYNQKGDEALQQKNYTSARMWYGEGIEYCDIYSIKKLTDIWLEKPEMRHSMRHLMNRCLDCLNEKAKVDDIAAIELLVTYHTEGIGAPGSDEVASYWKNRLEELLHPNQYEVIKQPKEPMRFFAGYTFSTEMPFGLTFGGIQEKAGWYVRVRSNFSFASTDYTCKLENETSVILDPDNDKTYQAQNKSNKTNTFAGTAGFIYKFNNWLYGSVGVGYGKRDLLSPFTLTDNTSGTQENIWCHNQTYSSKGLVGEVDAMIKIKNYYISIGCHTISFDYVDLNAGVGLFF